MLEALLSREVFIWWRSSRVRSSSDLIFAVWLMTSAERSRVFVFFLAIKIDFYNASNLELVGA